MAINNVRWGLSGVSRLAVVLGCALLSSALWAQTGQWVWMGGSSRTGISRKTPDDGQPSVFGQLGVPAAGNIPGARESATTWTDRDGDLWMFGGGNSDGVGILQNDLWRFHPGNRQWAWMGGSNTWNCKDCARAGIYGVLGTAAPENIPGSRSFASGWTDNDGNFWLYGGGGFDGERNIGTLSDLWEYSPASRLWTWMSGKSAGVAFINCGALGEPDPANNPGFREFSTSWTDKSGNLWLFGGWGLGGARNDLWRFDIPSGVWTRMAGSCSTTNENGNPGIPGVYGVPGEFDDRNTPGSREKASGWADNDGNLWLFGGEGRDWMDTYGYLDDLWEFDTSKMEWAWIGGGDLLPDAHYHQKGYSGKYGKLGKPTQGNTPGSRESAASWTDRNGDFWLFGGMGIDANDDIGHLDDLWKFEPSIRQWTWIGGSKTGGSSAVGVDTTTCPAGTNGVYGKLGVASSGGLPGARYGASTWIDREGDFWLFGGVGLDAYCKGGYLNDLWKYTFSQTASPSDVLTFSIESGTYTGSQYIKIIGGASGSTIYYTLDNSTPTDHSPKYTAGFTISRTTTIKAIALANGKDASDVATATYSIISSKPSGRE